MFKILSLLMTMFMLSACNDIDGKITVYADFMMVDEDGRHVMIPEGTHLADFSYKARKGEIEIEIEDIDNGKDREFEFQVPDLSKEDFRKERLELHFPATVGDRELDTKMLITNKTLSKTGPQGDFYRCREYGSVVYYYRPVVSYRVNRITHIAARINHDEDTLALFEATKNFQEREIVWVGECGGEMPENLEDVIPD